METKAKEKAYSKKEVIELLKQQINDCAEQIKDSNLSEYTAKKHIMDTKIVI